MNKWNDPTLSLGERCVAFAENEMANGVAEDKSGSFTSPRLREYFSICTRLTNGKEVPLTGFSAGNWCAAGASFCLHESLLPGETLPHGYRLGVVEVVSDLSVRGLYHKVDEVRNGTYQIKKGDVIIFDRSNPSNPASTWWRHIGRVYSTDNHGNFQCISGNNGGRWKISNHKLSQPTLLGFGEYPKLNIKPQILTSTIDWSHVDVAHLAPTQDTGFNLDSDAIFGHLDSLFGKKA
jgi:hypothetical protein